MKLPRSSDAPRGSCWIASNITSLFILFSKRTSLSLDRTASASATYVDLNINPRIAEDVQIGLMNELKSLRKKIDGTFNTLLELLNGISDMGLELEDQRNIFMAKAIESEAWNQHMTQYVEVVFHL